MPSIYEIAKRVGCHYTTVSRLRSGARLPSLKLMIRMCEAFGWDTGEAVNVLVGPREKAIEYVSTRLQALTDAELPE